MTQAAKHHQDNKIYIYTSIITLSMRKNKAASYTDTSIYTLLITYLKIL